MRLKKKVVLKSRWVRSEAKRRRRELEVVTSLTQAPQPPVKVLVQLRPPLKDPVSLEDKDSQSRTSSS